MPVGSKGQKLGNVLLRPLGKKKKTCFLGEGGSEKLCEPWHAGPNSEGQLQVSRGRTLEGCGIQELSCHSGKSSASRLALQNCVPGSSPTDLLQPSTSKQLAAFQHLKGAHREDGETLVKGLE